MWDASGDKRRQFVALELQRRRPETPDHIDANDRPDHVPAAAGNQHRPEDEGPEEVREGIRRYGSLLEGKERATRAHDRRSQDESLQLEDDDILPGSRRRLLVLANCAQHAPPW